ncbi:hypothetical protein NDU88_001278 [Pleurodeles waltl]|uniref:Uncharacterized protein n=1 Tax=Pleurodeles waltl TaxID=8319 RepID=A0AAV7Q2N4_PLEWA|nr:hypothetical protein NDU88_001278 [Pleurodeles waltl]
MTDALREKGIRYKWGHPFRLQCIWQNEMQSIRMLDDVQAITDLPLQVGDPMSHGPTQDEQSCAEEGRHEARSRRHEANKPMALKSK